MLELQVQKYILIFLNQFLLRILKHLFLLNYLQMAQLIKIPDRD